MGIVEIYRDDIKFMWSNNETFLCVFDKNNNFITDYDLCSGLKLMQNDDKIVFYINENEMVQGNWKLFATRISEDFSSEKIIISGENLLGSKTRKFNNDLPWAENCGPGKFVTRSEREKRIDICKQCPLFDVQNMTCSVNLQSVLDMTRHADKYCPEDKWGDKARVFSEVNEREGLTAERAMAASALIDKQDQSDFENELEEFLKGLE